MSEAVRLPPLAGGQADSWRALVEIAPSLGDNWLLVGGQMVFLHEIDRHSSETRATYDIDVVVNLRVDPGGLDRINRVLVDAEFVQDLPSPAGVAHRYRRGGASVDVLAPDHLGNRATLQLGFGRTIESPGTTQAFLRSGQVRVELSDGAAALIRRPTLIGAVVGKIAAVTELVSQSPAERARHMRDVDALARLVGPADRDGASLTSRERSSVEHLAVDPALSKLAATSLRLLAATKRKS